MECQKIEKLALFGFHTFWIIKYNNLLFHNNGRNQLIYHMLYFQKLQPQLHTDEALHPLYFFKVWIPFIFVFSCCFIT